MPRNTNGRDERPPLRPFIMSTDIPQYWHRPRRILPHVVTEINESFQDKAMMDDHLRGLTFRLHPRILKPTMALPYQPHSGDRTGYDNG